MHDIIGFHLHYLANGDSGVSESNSYYLDAANAREEMLSEFAKSNEAHHWTDMTLDDEHELCINDDSVYVRDGMDTYAWSIYPIIPTIVSAAR